MIARARDWEFCDFGVCLGERELAPCVECPRGFSQWSDTFFSRAKQVRERHAMNPSERATYRDFLKDKLRLAIDFRQTDQHRGVPPPPTG